MKRILSTVLAVIMITSCFPFLVSAETSNSYASDSNILEQNIIDGNVFQGEDAAVCLIDETIDEMLLTDVEINYNSETNSAQVMAYISQGNSEYILSAYGEMYNRQHVDYSICYIGDMCTQTGNFTLIYFEVYMDGADPKANIFIENDRSGDVIHATAEIEQTIITNIALVAETNLLTEEQYMNLVFYYSKSPNHSMVGDSDMNTFSMSGIVEEGDSLNSNSVQTANSYLDDWITLLNAMDNNSSLYYNNYNVPQSFFTEVTATAATKQWKTYTPSSNSFDYRMVRCAIYSIFSGTYSFYFAMIRPYIYETGSISFGFVQREDETTVTNFSYRTEMSTSSGKLRYVADRGLKFYPSIAVKLDTGTFKRAALRIELADVDNAFDLLMFTIGQIPQTAAIATIADILDLISTNPSTTEQNNSLIWVKSSSDPNITAFVLELDDEGIYKTGDQIEIDATMENWGTIHYYWSYSVVLP